MYAVVSSGGKQYRVEAGSMLTLERLDGEPGSSVTFDRILLIGDGDEVMIGTPVVAGASVSATVLGEALGPKLVIFKFKQKVKYRRRTGHRQHMTRVRIDAIHPTPERKAPAPAEKTDEKPMLKPKAASRTAKVATPKPAAPKVAATPKAVAQKAAAPKRAATKPAAPKRATKPAPAVDKPTARRTAKPKAKE